MNYVNPFELLGLRIDDPDSIQGEVLIKAKKRLLAEIDLNDSNSIVFQGKELTKSDCLRIIDELDNKDSRNFHFFILYNNSLRNFLTNGSFEFFENYRVEGIYKTQDFIDFVSPYFATEYNNRLSHSFQIQDITKVKILVSEKPLTNEEYLDRCYTGTYSQLKRLTQKIETEKERIENNGNAFTKSYLGNILSNLRKDVNIDLLNLLPKYFQQIRNQIANSIEQLSITIHNDPISNYIISYQLVEIANSLNTDGLVKERITKNYSIIRSNYYYYSERDQENNDKEEQSNPYNQDDSIEDEDYSEVENDDDQVIVIEENKEETTQEIHKNKKPAVIGYGIMSLIGLTFFGFAFFYDPLKRIALVIAIFFMVQSLWSAVKNKESSIWKILSDYGVIIAASAIGLFNITIALFALAFLAILNLNGVYNAIVRLIGKNQKVLEWWGLYATLIPAFLITLLYHSYLVQETDYISAYRKPDSTHSSNISNRRTPEYYYSKAKSLGSDNENYSAISELNKAIDLNPEYYDAFVLRGHLKIKNEDYFGAIEDFSMAILIDSTDASNFVNRGFLYYNLEKLNEALDDFNEAINIDPEFALAYRYRGDIKYDRNDDRGSVEDYSLAIKFDQSNPSYYFARGLAYYYLSEYQNSLKDITKSIELNPNRAQYYYDRGDVKQKIGDISGACEDWKTAYNKGYSVPQVKQDMFTPKVIRMENGNISGCNFQPKYANPELDNYLKIEVGNTDAAIKLINVSSSRCIRYVFINRYTTYSITNIPEGRYYLKIAYGEDWEKISIESECQGKFRKHTIFKKSDQILDYNLIETYDGWDVPSFELMLSIIQVSGEEANNSFYTSDISDEDFYNN